MLITSSGNTQAQRHFNAGRDRELRNACAEFESLLLNKMLQTMRETIPKSGLLDGGLREEIFTDLFDEQLAKTVSKGRGTGLGEMLYRQLSAGSKRAVDETTQSD